MNDKTFIETIRRNGITGDIIKAIVDDRFSRKSVQRNLYERYKTTRAGVPIKTRTYKIAGKEQTDKINNRLNNDFFGDIIDVKTGFFVGYPITYSIDRIDGESEARHKEKNQIIQDWCKAEIVEDLDAELVKSTSVCGESARILNIGTDGEPHVVNLFPWEVVVLYSGNEPVYGLYIYEAGEMELQNGRMEEKFINVVEFYDSQNRYIFEKRDEQGYKEVGKTPHLFSGCPVFSAKNNKECLADGEKVLELIDAYDRLLSDWDNEIEQFRLAYLKVVGADITEEAIEAAKRTGAFNLPDKDADIAYITKSLSVEAVEKLLDRIEENIYQFAQSVNSRDEHFAGTITGVALHHKLTPLEQKCLVMERKLVSTLRYQFKLLCENWRARRKADINYLDVNFTFTRKYPQNLQAEAEIAQKLKGIVSDRTILENLSIVPDVEEELRRIEEEAGARLEAFESARVEEEEEEKVDKEKEVA